MEIVANLLRQVYGFSWLWGCSGRRWSRMLLGEMKGQRKEDTEWEERFSQKRFKVIMDRRALLHSMAGPLNSIYNLERSSSTLQ